MQCKKLIYEISNYLDGELDSSLRIELEEHMTRCPDCKVIIDTTLKTIQVYRGCEPYPLPRSLHDRLLSALHRRYAEPSGETS